MAGILAWAADVVGGGAHGTGDAGDPSAAFTEEQRRRAAVLDSRAAALRAAIEELRGRIPPADIAKSLPHLHAHSLASSAALALQLNAHSATRHQAQIREETLQEENVAYEKAIQSCQTKIQEKLSEAHGLQSRLQEMDVIQRELEAEMESLHSNVDNPLIVVSGDGKTTVNTFGSKGHSKEILVKQLEEKKQELTSEEELIQFLEKKWAQVQQDLVKRPTPAQREKALERQLHGLIEQLTAKQTQVEGFQSDIHSKKLELEKLTVLSERFGSGPSDASSMRSRSVRTNMLYADNAIEAHHRYPVAGRIENIPKFMLLRSAFVLYILALHVLVFIKISF